MKEALYIIKKSCTKVFRDSVFVILAIAFALLYLIFDYLIFVQSTTVKVFLELNNAVFVLSALALDLVTATLFGISLSMLIYLFKNKKTTLAGSGISSVSGAFFSLLASGCPVCGAWLLSILGIAGSLAVFPLQGLEFRVISVVLLLFSIYMSAKYIMGACSKEERKKLHIILGTILAFSAIVLFFSYKLDSSFKVKFQKSYQYNSQTSQATKTSKLSSSQLQKIYDQVNPKEGYKINAKYGNMGYKLVQAGVIDFDKFKSIYKNAGVPLTEKQLKVFSKEGLDENIKIDRENAYFLLNLFWAFGLANKNPILTEGQITKYGDIGSFASTGGWTIAKRNLKDFYAKLELAKLNEKQQKMVEKVASAVYRPCCGNPTSFPDCNHGMALLGVLELMAANGATEEELFEAAKYFSAYWFPGQMVDIATYFKVTENKDFSELDPRIILSSSMFSARGWSNVKNWLNKNVKTDQINNLGGGACGV